MKNVTRLCCLLALLSVALLPGCSRSDSESFYEIDTFERYGEEIRVLIGHDQEAISIYNNDDKRDLLDKAALLQKIQCVHCDIHSIYLLLIRFSS